MLRTPTFFAFLIGISGLKGETILVTVGDTGCSGRQITVRECFEKLAGVSSVTVLPRSPKDPPAQRTFVVVSAGIGPDQNALRSSLGRRAKHYPILDCKKQPAPVERAGG